MALKSYEEDWRKIHVLPPPWKTPRKVKSSEHPADVRFLVCRAYCGDQRASGRQTVDEALKDAQTRITNNAVKCRMRRERLVRPTKLKLCRPDNTRQRRIRQLLSDKAESLIRPGMRKNPMDVIKKKHGGKATR